MPSLATVVQLAKIQESEVLDIRPNQTTYATALDLDRELSMTRLLIALETRDGRQSALIDLDTNNDSFWFIQQWLRERIPACWVIDRTKPEPCEF